MDTLILSKKKFEMNNDEFITQGKEYKASYRTSVLTYGKSIWISQKFDNRNTESLMFYKEMVSKSKRNLREMYK